MKSVISKILSGETYRAENAEKSDKFKEIQKNSIAAYENFLNILNEEQKAMFEEVLDDMFALEAEQSKTSFEEGFKLGLLVAFEAVAE